MKKIASSLIFGLFLFISLASQAQEVYVVADPNIADANLTNKLPTGYSLKWVSSTKTDNPENTVYIMLTGDYDIRADLERFVNQGKKVYLLPEDYTPPRDSEVTELSIPQNVIPEIDPPHIPPKANCFVPSQALQSVP